MKLSLPTKKEQGAVPAPKTAKKWPKILRNVVIVAVLVGGYFGWQHFGGKGKPAEEAVEYTKSAVEQRTITQTISSSGTLTAADSYTVTTLREGEVLWSEFEEGDLVEKDGVLFELDSSDTESSIERAEISLAQAQRSYKNALERQYLLSDYDGTVYEVEVEVGDSVKAGDLIATLQDRTSLTLEIPFSDDEADTFYVGQPAQVILQSTFETLDATVEEIASYTSVLTGNRIVRMVTLSVPNGGGLSAGLVGTATVGTSAAADSGSFQEREIDTIVAENGGEITSLSISEGDAVWKDMTILTLGGEDMEETLQTAAESLRNTELSTESARDSLDDYTITSPIAGTVVEKMLKTGDNAKVGDQMCIIYDLSYLEMTMNIDELDIRYIEVGQEVEITADALAGELYSGEVTKVSVAGSTYNGTTTYPVTVRVNEMADLLPGMNVDAEIMVAQATDVLTVPSVMVQRGDVVMITADSPSAVNALEDNKAPEGYVYVPVEMGASDADYVEITSGLQLGDTVAMVEIASMTSFDRAMMGQMPDGMEMQHPTGVTGGASSQRTSGGTGGMR